MRSPTTRTLWAWLRREVGMLASTTGARGIRDIDDRRPFRRFHMPHISGGAFHIDLPAAGDVEMADLPDVARHAFGRKSMTPISCLRDVA